MVGAPPSPISRGWYGWVKSLAGGWSWVLQCSCLPSLPALGGALWTREAESCREPMLSWGAWQKPKEEVMSLPLMNDTASSRVLSHHHLSAWG